MTQHNGSVVMLIVANKVLMLSVIRLSVIILTVVAPFSNGK
jgi:hypothetical protein